MRDLLFTPIAFEQYNDWQIENKQIFTKLKKLIKETAKSPFEEQENQKLLNMILQVIGPEGLQRNIG